jgi:hypothetical protein
MRFRSCQQTYFLSCEVKNFIIDDLVSCLYDITFPNLVIRALVAARSKNSAESQRSQRLGGKQLVLHFHRRDAENAEIAQRSVQIYTVSKSWWRSNLKAEI